MRLVILSGPSGAGKSTAIKVMEDMNFFCVDNLPVALLPKFLDLCRSSSGEIIKVATVVDIRERGFLKDFPIVFRDVKDAGHDVELVYLEATDDAILRRFSETRRRHPLEEGSPLEGIRLERKLLADVKAMANKVIDTSNYNVHQLKEVIRDYFSDTTQLGKMTVHLVSFSYRYGIPTDADLVIDVRFLPNPYFVEGLKGLDGRDDRVKGFVLDKEETLGFIERFSQFLNYLIPFYRKEGKVYLTIAIGCTGGKHRSPSIVEILADNIDTGICTVKKRHRDIDKP